MASDSARCAAASDVILKLKEPSAPPNVQASWYFSNQAKQKVERA